MNLDISKIHKEGKMEAAREIGLAAAKAGIPIKDLTNIDEWKAVLETAKAEGHAEEAIKCHEHTRKAREEERTRILEIIKSGRVILRDPSDYLPAAYQYLKGKNDLRDNLITAITSIKE